jgi:hypothetical protein
MNSHLNYLMATQRTTELMRTARNTRTANTAKTANVANAKANATQQPDRQPARTVLRVRLRNAAAGRLRVRRA